MRHRNKKMSQVYRAYNEANLKNQLSWKDITSREFYGFLGISISSGVNNSNYDHAIDRFDEANTRETLALKRIKLTRYVTFGRCSIPI